MVAQYTLSNLLETFEDEFQLGDETDGLRLVRGTGSNAGELILTSKDGTVFRDFRAQEVIVEPSGATPPNDANAIRLKADGNGGVAIYKNDGSTFGAVCADEIALDNSGNMVKLKAPSGLAADITWVLPSTDPGQSGYAMLTDGAGNLSMGLAPTDPATLWRLFRYDFDESDDGVTALFTPPSVNTIIKCVTVRCDVGAGPPKSLTNRPKIRVGTATDDDAYMEDGDSKLSDAGIYERIGYSDVLLDTGNPEPLIMTMDNEGKTFSGALFIQYGQPS